jgi:multidrug efflux pump subunit AcrA (membrane-fusion protein)
MRRRSVIINGALVVVLAAAVTGAVIAVGEPTTATASTEQTAKATRATVSSTVTASGNLSAATSVAVNFAGSGGTVTAIYVKVGDKVVAGQELAKVDDTSALQSLASANASLASAKANYATTTAGQTSAEKSRDQTSIRSAQVSVDNATTSLSQAKATYRLDKSQQDALVSSAQATYDAATDATARANALTSLTNAKHTRDSTLLRDQQSIDTAQGQVSSAQASLRSQQASAAVNSQGATSGSVASAKAQVTSAQVQVDEAQTTVDETVLRAPVAGTVSTLSGVVGQSSSGSGAASSSSSTSASTSSSTSSGFLTLSSLSDLQVTTKVAEADASHVRIGQSATITFSASSNTAQGTVTAIDVSSTVTNNVVEYGVTVTLTDPPKVLKLGQTASVSITTATVENALSVPTSAVTRVGNSATVTVRKDGVDTPTPVTLGVEGDSSTEIKSGVSEGTTVVLSSGSGLPSGFTFPSGGFPGGGLGGGLGG